MAQEEEKEEYESVASEESEDELGGFGLTPAAYHSDPIDYRTKEGQALWKQATDPLSKEQFECTTEGLRDFLLQVQRRAETMGWDNSILNIPIDSDDVMGETIDFFKHYGELKMEHLRECTKNYVNKKTRAAQDNTQLYHCLYNSLAKNGRDKVSLKDGEYTVKSTRCGVLLLKVIIQTSTIDTNATTSAIRMALASLDSYMHTVNDDITKFNEYVEAQVQMLKARGQDTQDLTVNLFKAYATVKDKNFREYITQKENEYEESNEELPYKKLMLLAENKYKIRQVRQAWNEVTPEEEKIIALEAFVKKLQKGGKGTKGKGKSAAKTDDTKPNTKKGKGAKNFKEPEPWMLKAPNEGEAKTKTVNNKEWHWCPTHMKWTRHKAEECKGIGGKQGNNKGKDRKLQLARAVTALAEESEEE